MKIVKKNQLKIVIFTAVKNSCILHGRVFVMKQTKMSRFLVLLFGIFLFSCCAASFDTGDQLSWIDKKEVR